MKEVKEYHLEGAEIRIKYLKDKPCKLEYESPQGILVYSEGDIDRVELEIGLFASVLLDAAPDSHQSFLSVIIPSANIPESAKSVPVNTIAVYTRKNTTIGGPSLVEGQVQLYKTAILEGNAW